MPFVYRLQKILDFRIRKKEEQLLQVQKAQQQVYIAEENIRKNEAEIRQTIQNKRTADFRMMEYYDNYLHHLWDKAEALEQGVKVLEKHKEKQKEAYREEQKAIELKQFSEIGVQRFFIRAREEAEEEEMLEKLKQLENE